MFTAIVLGLGSLVGGALGFKLGRVYEKLKGEKTKKKDKKDSQ